MLTDNNQIFRNCFVIVYCHLTKVSSQINKCIIFEHNELSITLYLLYGVTCVCQQTVISCLMWRHHVVLWHTICIATRWWRKKQDSDKKLYWNWSQNRLTIFHAKNARVNSVFLGQWWPSSYLRREVEQVFAWHVVNKSFYGTENCCEKEQMLQGRRMALMVPERR